MKDGRLQKDIYENMPEYPLLCKGMNGILFREFEGQIPSI